MRPLDQIAREIGEISDALDGTEARLLDLAMSDPWNLAGIDALRRIRSGLVARLDRLTQPQHTAVLRLAG